MGVVFSQRLLKNRQRVLFQVEEAASACAWELIAAGFKFECEVLGDSRVYFNCSGLFDGVVQELWNVVVENGPAVTEAIHRLINSAYAVYSDHTSKQDLRNYENSFSL